jgi:hypothetical protein
VRLALKSLLLLSHPTSRREGHRRRVDEAGESPRRFPRLITRVYPTLTEAKVTGRPAARLA